MSHFTKLNEQIPLNTKQPLTHRYLVFKFLICIQLLFIRSTLLKVTHLWQNGHFKVAGGKGISEIKLKQ
jgi:hypothetical protein